MARSRPSPSWTRSVSWPPTRGTGPRSPSSPVTPPRPRGSTPPPPQTRPAKRASPPYPCHQVHLSRAENNGLFIVQNELSYHESLITQSTIRCPLSAPAACPHSALQVPRHQHQHQPDVPPRDQQVQHHQAVRLQQQHQPGGVLQRPGDQRVPEQHAGRAGEARGAGRQEEDQGQEEQERSGGERTGRDSRLDQTIVWIRQEREPGATGEL